MKPGSKSFETLLTKEGVNPDETMFIDDGTNNIKAAQELGIHAFSLSTEKYGAEVLRTCLNRVMALTAAVTLMLKKRCSVYL